MNFSILSFILVNRPRALQVKPSCISGINLSPTSKKLFTVSLILHLKKAFSNGILLNGVLMPKLLNKPFASYSFTNLDFLIP